MISRRSFLKWGGLALFASGGLLSASADPARMPLRITDSEGKHVLVVVFLRGGLDGMHALVPYADKEYYKARPNLSVPQVGSLVLDENFSLNPALKALLPHFQSRQMACICAIGTSDRSRSHFIAQDFLEFGGHEPQDGWLNRYLTDDGLAFSTKAQLPTLLKGERPVLNATGVEDLLAMTPPPALFSGEASPARLTREEERFRKRLAHLRPPSGDDQYPETSLGQQLRAVAFLLKQGVELEAVHCEMSGFDTHSRQVDGLWPGRLLGLNRSLYDFSEALDVFWRDLGDFQERVTILTVTEFGRRLAENASLGTDHGLASASFVMGGRVNGGRVYGEWPGLNREHLVDGIDLPVTTDYRSVMNEYTRANGRAALFPDFKSKQRLGMFS